MKFARSQFYLPFSAMLALSGFMCWAYEVVPEGNREASALSASYVAAPQGMRALMIGHKSVAFFDADGNDIDIVWRKRKPHSLFSVSQKGALTEIRSARSGDVEPMAFRFDKTGLLASVQREGNGEANAQDQETFFPRAENPLKAFWKKTDADQIDYADYWKGTDRLRLGYSNPNAAGALFAECAVFLFSVLVFFSPIWIRLISGAALAASVWMLMLTGSRGSFIGFCVGAVTIVAISGLRGGNLRKFALFAGTVAVVAGLMFSGLFGDRFGAKLLEFDESNAIRVRCWQAAPAMMVSAPKGWGPQCGRAYCEWFQAEEENHPQFWLINSHLTWMVGHGWYFRLGYVSGWILILMLLGLQAKRSQTARVALGVWIAWAVALWFSTIGQYLTLWILPVLSLLPVTVLACMRRIKVGLLNVGVYVVLSALLGAGMCAALWFFGDRTLAKMAFPPHRANGMTTIGREAPKICILNDDLVTSLGLVGTFGKEVRDFMRRNPECGAIAVVKKLARVPADTDTLVVAGRHANTFLLWRWKRKKWLPNVKRIVFLSPSFSPKPRFPELVRCSDLQFLSGDVMKSLYLEKGEKPLEWMKFVPEAGIYVPGWMDIALKEKK